MLPGESKMGSEKTGMERSTVPDSKSKLGSESAKGTENLWHIVSTHTEPSPKREGYISELHDLMRLKVDGGWLYRYDGSIAFVPVNTSWAVLAVDIKRQVDQIATVLERMEKTIELLVYTDPNRA